LWRVYLIYFMMCLFGIAIIGRAAFLQLVKGEELKTKAQQLTTKYFNIEAARGNIFSSDGSLLATSSPIYEIRMDVNGDHITQERFNDNIDSLALCLSNLFKDKYWKEYKRELIQARKDDERFFLIHRNVSFSQLKELKKFPIFRLGKNEGGLIALQKNRRERPFKELAARTIGYWRDSLQPVGIEGAYHDYLKGVSGKRLKQKVSGGGWIPINDDNELEPQDGGGCGYYH